MSALLSKYERKSVRALLSKYEDYLLTGVNLLSPIVFASILFGAMVRLYI